MQLGNLGIWQGLPRISYVKILGFCLKNTFYEKKLISKLKKYYLPSKSDVNIWRSCRQLIVTWLGPGPQSIICACAVKCQVLFNHKNSIYKSILNMISGHCLILIFPFVRILITSLSTTIITLDSPHRCLKILTPGWDFKLIMAFIAKGNLKQIKKSAKCY